MIYEGNCTSMLRVCNDHESPVNSEGRTVCRPNVLGRKTVRIMPANWGAAVLNTLIVQILLMEQLQVPVELLQYEGSSTNYYVHDGTFDYPPHKGDWSPMAKAYYNPECTGYPSYLNIPNHSSECSHASLEVWSAPDYFQYVVQERIVEDAGSLGVLGAVGWYINTFALAAYPELASFRGYYDAATTRILERPLTFSEHCALNSTDVCAAFDAEFKNGDGSLKDGAPADTLTSYFVEQLPTDAHTALAARLSVQNISMPSPFYGGAFTPESDENGDPIGHIGGVSCDWVEYELEVIEKNNLALRHRRYSGGGLQQILAASVHNLKPYIFYWWTPDSLLKVSDFRGEEWGLARVALPTWTESCADKRPTHAERCADDIPDDSEGCDYPTHVIYKALTKSLPEHSPIGYGLLKAFSITGAQQESALSAVAYGGKTFREVSCEWVHSYQETWNNWLVGLNSVECPLLFGEPCGGPERGTCVAKEPPYPEGVCDCVDGFAGEACGEVQHQCQTGEILQQTDYGTDCIKCPGGTYEVDNIVCAPIGSNFYGDPAGGIDETGLMPCPPNTRHLALKVDDGGMFEVGSENGATSIAQCVCEPGYYTPTGNTTDCLPCPEGAECKGGAFPPFAQRGYGLVNPDSFNFFPCLLKQFCTHQGGSECDCLGGSVTLNTTAAGTLAWVELSQSLVYNAYTCETGFQEGSELCSICADGFGKQLDVCKECNFSAGFYVFTSLILVLFWFPLMRLLIENWVKSTYTSVSYIQYLGLYSTMKVTWDPSVASLLRGLSLFNLNLSSIHLPCAGYDFEGMWLIQGIFIPILYPAACLLGIGMEFAYAKMCESNFPGTQGLLALGVLPKTDFSRLSLMEQYMGPGLFYANLYFYSGVYNALLMLICVDDKEGAKFLYANPSMTCWEGDHTGYGVVAILTLIVYMFIFVFGVIYLLFVYVPKHGLDNIHCIKICGFLYRPFLKSSWYWEMVEIFRRALFAVIVSLGAVIDPLTQSLAALAGIMLEMIVELATHPFQYALYDFLDETTTIAECVLIMLGVLLVLDAGDSVDTLCTVLAMVLLVSTLVLVAFVAFTDIYYGTHRRVVKIRRKKNLILADGLFDTQFADQLVLDYVSQADEAALVKFKKVERLLVSKTLSGDLRNSTANGRLAALLKVEPFLLEMMIADPKDAPEQSGETTQRVGSLVLKAQHRWAASHSSTPLAYIFTDDVIGPILGWAAEKASRAQLDEMRHVIEDIQSFQEERLKKRGLCGRLSALLFHATLVKDAQKRAVEAKALRKSERGSMKELFLLSKNKIAPSPSMRRNCSSRNEDGTLRPGGLKDVQLMPRNSFFGHGKVRKNSVGNQQAYMDPFEQLILSLAQQIGCEEVSIVPKPESETDLKPASITQRMGGSPPSLSFQGEPIIRCATNLAVVGVGSRESVLYVPIIGSARQALGVLVCAHKYTDSGRVGEAFYVADAELASIVAEVLVEQVSLLSDA